MGFSYMTGTCDCKGGPKSAPIPEVILLVVYLMVYKRFMVQHVRQSINTSFPSAQQVELAVLINLLQLIQKLLNIISQSVYVENYFKH